MLALQRTVGNAAVTRLLARRPAGPGAVDMTPTDFVFILGAKDDAALAVAKEHYRSVVMSSLHKGEFMEDDDEMWAELARLAEVQTDVKDGVTHWIYIANAFVTDNKPEWEDNPLLYTKSSYYYMPEEL